MGQFNSQPSESAGPSKPLDEIKAAVSAPPPSAPSVQAAKAETVNVDEAKTTACPPPPPPPTTPDLNTAKITSVKVVTDEAKTDNKPTRGVSTARKLHRKRSDSSSSRPESNVSTARIIVDTPEDDVKTAESIRASNAADLSDQIAIS